MNQFYFTMAVFDYYDINELIFKDENQKKRYFKIS